MIFKRKKVMFFLNSSIESGASSSNYLQETHHRTQMTHQPLVAYLWEIVCKKAQKNPTLDRGGENKKKSEQEQREHQGGRRWRKRKISIPQSVEHGEDHAGPGEKCEEKGVTEKKHYVVNTSHPIPPASIISGTEVSGVKE